MPDDDDGPHGPTQSSPVSLPATPPIRYSRAAEGGTAARAPPPPPTPQLTPPAPPSAHPTQATPSPAAPPSTARYSASASSASGLRAARRRSASTQSLQSCDTSPAAAGRGDASGVDWRDYISRFYRKWNPAKLPYVDTLLAAHVGRERELYAAMVQKYVAGPQQQQQQQQQQQDEGLLPTAEGTPVVRWPDPLTPEVESLQPPAGPHTMPPPSFASPAAPPRYDARSRQGGVVPVPGLPRRRQPQQQQGRSASQSPRSMRGPQAPAGALRGGVGGARRAPPREGGRSVSPGGNWQGVARKGCFVSAKAKQQHPPHRALRQRSRSSEPVAQQQQQQRQVVPQYASSSPPPPPPAVGLGEGGLVEEGGLATVVQCKLQEQRDFFEVLKQREERPAEDAARVVAAMQERVNREKARADGLERELTALRHIWAYSTARSRSRSAELHPAAVPSRLDSFSPAFDAQRHARELSSSPPHAGAPMGFLRLPAQSPSYVPAAATQSVSSAVSQLDADGGGGGGSLATPASDSLEKDDVDALEDQLASLSREIRDIHQGVPHAPRPAAATLAAPTPPPQAEAGQGRAKPHRQNVFSSVDELMQLSDDTGWDDEVS